MRSGWDFRGRHRRKQCQWVGENREIAVNGLGDSKTLELRLKGLGGYKQEGSRVLAEFGW